MQGVTISQNLAFEGNPYKTPVNGRMRAGTRSGTHFVSRFGAFVHVLKFRMRFIVYNRSKVPHFADFATV